MNKNFEDFLKILTVEKVYEISNTADNVKAKFLSTQDDFQSTQEKFEDFCRSTSIFDFYMTLGLLKLYHDWLNSQ